MKHFFLIILFFALLFPFMLFAEERVVKVIFIADGDTLHIINSKNKKIKIRLAGIDAPEINQRYGKQSQEYLSKLILNKKLTYKPHNRDDYGRVIATLYGNNKNLNYEMIKAGFAWHYKHYNKSKKYAEAERKARKQKLGLWKDSNAQPPWEYRTKHK